MALSPRPDPEGQPPDDGRATDLSPWERRMIARIEHDLVTADPRLAMRMNWPAARWWPLSARSTVLLVIALIGLVCAASLVPASWWAIGLITTVMIGPCLVLAAAERRNS